MKVFCYEWGTLTMKCCDHDQDFYWQNKYLFDLHAYFLCILQLSIIHCYIYMCVLLLIIHVLIWLYKKYWYNRLNGNRYVEVCICAAHSKQMSKECVLQRNCHWFSQCLVQHTTKYIILNLHTLPIVFELICREISLP